MDIHSLDNQIPKSNIDCSLVFNNANFSGFSVQVKTGNYRIYFFKNNPCIAVILPLEHQLNNSDFYNFVKLIIYKGLQVVVTKRMHYITVTIFLQQYSDLLCPLY